MNVTFRLRGAGSERDALEKKFIQHANDDGIKGVAGHRSVGGECFLPFGVRRDSWYALDWQVSELPCITRSLWNKSKL